MTLASFTLSAYGLTFKPQKNIPGNLIHLKLKRQNFVHTENYFALEKQKAGKVVSCKICRQLKHNSKTSSVLHNVIIESSFNAREYQINFSGFKLIRYA